MAPVSFNLILPSRDTAQVRVFPRVTDNTWNSGDTITIYEDAIGYWVTDNISARIDGAGLYGPLVNMAGGNYTVNIVDEKAGVLIAAVPVVISGEEIKVRYSPGLIANYYSDIAWKTPAATGIASRVYYADTASGRASDISNWPVGLVGRAEQFSVTYDGFFRALTEDDYTFTLSSDDGSWMAFDGNTGFIGNGGNHSYASRSATIHLTPGYYPVTVSMYEYTGAAVVYLTYKTPAMASPAVVDQLYHLPSTAPIADFSGTPTAGTAPLTVKFTDKSIDATAWSWDFGDGTSGSHAKNPSHTYSTAGKYPVTLVATNAFGSTTIKKEGYITVVGSFSPGFSASYFRGLSWSEFAASRVDSRIQFTDRSSTWPQDMVGGQENFSVRWDGYLYVPDDDTYTFYLNSDDGSYLFIDDTEVIDNGGNHSAREYSTTTSLSSGYHHVVVTMWEYTGTAVAQLRFTNTSITSPQYVANIWHP